MFSVGLSVMITPQGQKFLNNLSGKVLSHLLGLNNSTPFFFKERCAPLALSSMPLFVTAARRAKCDNGVPAAGVTWKVHQLIITQWQGVRALLRECGAVLWFWALCDYDGCPAYIHNPNPTSNLYSPPLPMSGQWTHLEYEWRWEELKSELFECFTKRHRGAVPQHRR